MTERYRGQTNIRSGDSIEKQRSPNKEYWAEREISQKLKAYRQVK